VTQDASRHALRVEIASELIGVIPVVLSRVRRAFDLDATPSAIFDALSSDNCLASSFARSPGLRLPGAMDSFETAIRTIVGQQVSVSAATTVMGRIVQAFGQRIESPWPQLFLNSITPERIARESVDTLAPLGLNSARARAILSVARAIVDGKLELEHSNDPERTVEQLQHLDGIGPWTAHYFGMRILGWPDAFIASDLVVRKQLAPLSVKQIEARSQVWRPWRAYAVMHLWHAAGFFHSTQREMI
jgi:AraC family transcriptional regulator of adaptative response / DNA-3-methyladenine glycosylase II